MAGEGRKAKKADVKTRRGAKAIGTVAGLGPQGYELALAYVLKRPGKAG